jgi:hypothetical protein
MISGQRRGSCTPGTYSVADHPATQNEPSAARRGRASRKPAAGIREKTWACHASSSASASAGLRTTSPATQDVPCPPLSRTGRDPAAPKETSTEDGGGNDIDTPNELGPHGVASARRHSPAARSPQGPQGLDGQPAADLPAALTTGSVLRAVGARSNLRYATLRAGGRTRRHARPRRRNTPDRGNTRGGRRQGDRVRRQDVRHSYATAGRNAKIDWEALSKRIGHADVAFTMK